MKKIAFMAVIALFSISAQAVSLPWGSQAISFDGVILKNDTSVSASLIYIASGSLLESYTLTPSFTASDIGTVEDGKDGTLKSGKTTGTYEFDYESKVDGDSFALLVTYNNGTDTYYNLSSTINTLAGVTSAISTPTPWNEFAITDVRGTKGQLVAGGGWVPVPEPATGMLALAGLAMLIRRKRA